MTEALATVLLGLHLLAVNVAAAGPLVCLWLSRRRRRGDILADEVGRRLAWWSCWGLVAGLVLGVLSLTLDAIWTDERYFRSVIEFPRRKFVFAGIEVFCSLAWSGAYAMLWRRWAARPWLHGTLAFLTASNLLYHFPPLWSVLAIVSARPELAETMYSQTTAGWLKHPEIASRTVHVWLASFAVTGAALMAIVNRCRKNVETAERGRLIAAGARWALAPSVLQLLVGLWVLSVLPDNLPTTLLGGDLIGTVLLASSVVAALAMLHLLSSVAMGDTDSWAARGAIWLMIIVVVLMAGTLRRVRQLEGRPALPVINRTVQARSIEFMRDSAFRDARAPLECGVH